MTGAQMLVYCLLSKGVNVIFGVPGEQLKLLYLAIHSNKGLIRHITCRHEGGASLMAVGYSKMTSKVGVCLVIPGPGICNAIIGLQEACTSSIPILLITVQNVPSDDLANCNKYIHGLDHLKMLSCITKLSIRVNKITDIPDAIEQAFQVLEGFPQGPVLLEFDEKILAQDIQNITNISHIFLSHKNTRHYLELSYQMLYQKAIKLIQGAQKIFILVGAEATRVDISTEILQLIDKTCACVATTVAGKGAVSDYSDNSLGVFLDKHVLDLLYSSDLCIAIGVDFNQTDTDDWTVSFNMPVITFTSCANTQQYCSYCIELTGDIKVTLKNLLKLLNSKKNCSEWNGKIIEAKAKTSIKYSSGIISDIRMTLDHQSILVSDTHLMGYDAVMQYKVNSSKEFLFPSNSYMVGYGLPVAIGCKIAFPDKKVVVICGDGGFMMANVEICTALKYNINITCVIINNNCYGSLKSEFPEYIYETSGIKLINPNFMKFADAYGILSFKIKNRYQVKQTLRQAVSLEKFTIIELVDQ